MPRPILDNNHIRSCLVSRRWAVGLARLVPLHHEHKKAHTHTHTLKVGAYGEIDARRRLHYRWGGGRGARHRALRLLLGQEAGRGSSLLPQPDIFFLSQIYRSWGLVAHRRWARLMLDRKCLVEVPNAPRHRAERALAEADYDEEAAFGSYFSPEAGHRSGPGGPIYA